MSRLKDENAERDFLVEYSSRMLHFYRNNKVATIVGTLAVVLAIGLVISYVVHSDQQEDEAQILLGTAEEYLMQGDYERALNGDEQLLTLGFIQIANNYGNTGAGNLANYYAAIAEYELENYENALDYIQLFDPPEGILGVGPISFHAVILTELGEYEDAAETFLRAANWHENDATTPYNIMEAALCYKSLDMNAEAIEQLDIVVTEYSDSQRATEAERLREMLTIR